MSLTGLLNTFKDERTIIQTANGYIEKDGNGISLKGVLQRGRLKLKRETAPRRQGVTFRPSAITYSYCRRLKVGQLAGIVTLWDNPATPKQQFHFDMGHAIHNIVQGYFWDIGILKGSFKCIKCDKIYHDLVAPTTCPSGKSTHERKHLKYKEIIVKNQEYLISGRCDGELLIPEANDPIMDIKSIQNRTVKSNERQFCFEDLAESGPKEDHVAQLTLYMWIMEKQWGHLVYVSKNDHQIKTFAIPYDYDKIGPYLLEIKHLINTANDLKAGKKVHLPEPCGREDCKCHEILSKMPN